MFCKHEESDDVLEVDFGVVSRPGDDGSPQGREAPVGRSVSGRGHFGSGEDTT